MSAPLFTGQSLRVLLPEIVAMDLYRHGNIEPELTAVLLDALRERMVFVDVGAQYGYYSLLASSRVGPTGLVFAFEPGRRALRLLVRNLAGLSNVRLERAAVWERAGRRTLYDFGARHSALSSLFPRARVPAAESSRLAAEQYEVEALSLDDYFAPLGLIPDVVKVDAESSELQVLKGMRRILTEGSPLVTVEVGDYEGTAQELSRRCVDFMESLGYRCLEYEDGRLVPHTPRRTYAYGNLFFRKQILPQSHGGR